jgi:pyruvate ferredoxin oxidoreductase gamma subunit
MVHERRNPREGANLMFQIRIHGRGGQGVVSGAELLSVAAFHEGRHAQAFPSFGSERMGAPVVAFCRIDDKEVRLREPVLEPDALIIQDPTLLHQVDLFGGVVNDALVLVNSARTVADLGLASLTHGFRRFRFVTIPATDIARRHVGRPVPNVPLLAAFAALSGVVSIVSLERAIREKFPAEIAKRNVAAANEAHQLAQTATESAHA